MVLTYISMLCFLGQAVNAVKTTMHFHSWDEQKKKKFEFCEDLFYVFDVVVVIIIIACILP